MTEYEFTYSSEPAMADQVLDDLLRVLAECSVEQGVVQGLGLAVSEAFTNAAVHGNREHPEKKVHIFLHVMESTIIADIIDHGEGGVERISRKKPSTAMDEGGRGVDLIRHYASSTNFTETADGGLKVSIVFNRTREKRRKVNS